MDRMLKNNQTETSNLELAIVKQGSTSSSSSVSRPNVFTNGEIELFYRLYRYGRQSRQTYSTRFSALEDFILETRRTSGFLENYNELTDIINENDDERASLMRTWLCQVAPSCVFRHRCTEYGQTSFFKCCFTTCATPVSSQYALIRHYREKHYNQIPAGIFGNLVLFNCVACGLQFKREEHLNQHFSKILHITRMAMLGTYLDLIILLFKL